MIHKTNASSQNDISETIRVHHCKNHCKYKNMNLATLKK